MSKVRDALADLPACYDEMEAPPDMHSLHEESIVGVLRCRGCHRAFSAECSMVRRRRWHGLSGSGNRQAPLLEEACFEKYIGAYVNGAKAGTRTIQCISCRHCHFVTSEENIFATEDPWIATEIEGRPLFIRSPYRILVCSLDADECEKIKLKIEEMLPATALQGIQRALVVISLHLDYGGLRDFTFNNNIKEGGIDLVLLIHYAEGRTLLTDADGLYNSFLYKACEVSGGNIFIVLTGIPTEEGLSNIEAVEDIVGNGGQSSVVDINMNMRFMTWEEEPSQTQIDHIKLGADFGIAPLNLPQGVRQYAISVGRSARFFCSIL